MLVILVLHSVSKCITIEDVTFDVFRSQNLIIFRVLVKYYAKIMLDLDLTPPETITLSCNMTGQCNYTLFDVVFGLDQSGFTPPWVIQLSFQSHCQNFVSDRP